MLIPGLVDAHAHLGLASPAPPGAPPEERVRASARAQLDAGVLAIREPGGPDRASAGIGPHEGLPRTFTAGRFLTPPGSYFPGLAREVAAADLPAAAEEEARASGAWAKVIGDWVGPDGRLRANYPAEVLAEAARRVHAAGARIAVHAISAAAIEAAIEAGFDSIEHGIGLRDDHVAAMATRGIALVPTLVITSSLRQVGWWMELGLAPVAARLAAEAGVLVLAGTDAGMVPHGMVRQEIRCLLEAGLPQGSRWPPARGRRGASWGCRASRRARRRTSWPTRTTHAAPPRCSPGHPCASSTAVSSPRRRVEPSHPTSPRPGNWPPPPAIC
ncbi:MAG: amidohydrolase family protein [Chloroflexi bacterium]|nr:amidohydrolase family protein [Chloroflexota bacterium]